MQQLLKWYERMTFQRKVTALLSAFIFIIFIALYAYIHTTTSKNIKEEVGKKALAVSETIATSSNVIDAFDENHSSADLQSYTDHVQKMIGAEFIVIGDHNEIRIAHPIANRIGKKMVGDDNTRALQQGESYISQETGSIGVSIRGKSPIIKDGEIVGVVSVGYLLKDIPQLVWAQNRSMLLLLIIFLIIGLAGSMSIAQYLKELLHKMEPEEIAALLLQKEAILQSTKEGIIAVDPNEHITMINQSAKDILELKQSVIHQPLHTISSFPLLKYASTHDGEQDIEHILTNEPVLLNVSSLMMDDVFYGAVVTFRKKTDLEKVTQELQSIQQYSEGLRAQTHEFSNKIHTLYGLLQLHHIEEAKQFIEEVFNTSSSYYPSLESQIEDPIIHGLLIAKYNIANEKGISFKMEDDSSLQRMENDTIRQVVLLTLGNLIDNAFTATQSAQHPVVQLHITDIGHDLVMEIDDNGEGISTAILDRLFEDGVTSKQKVGHGKGLFLVQQAIHAVGGDILLDESDLGGTRFMVILPQKGARI